MEFLNWTLYGNELRSWAIALAIAVGLVAGLRLAVRLVVRRLAKLAVETTNDVDDLVAAVLRSIHPLVLVIVSVAAGARLLTLPERVADVLGGAAVLALLIQAGVSGSVIVRSLIDQYTRQRAEKEDAAAATTLSFMGFILRLALWSVVLLVALANLGVDVTALVTGLGIGGLAVALATQNLLADLFASLSIVLDKPFVIGDFIIVGDLLGTVDHVGLKTTRIRSLSGEQLVFSNADLLSSRIRNYKWMEERRAVFSFRVIYDTPGETLQAIPGLVRQIVEAQENARFDRAHFKAFGTFSLEFEVVYYVLSPDYNQYMDIQQAINLAIFREFADQGIEFAYPTQTLLVRPDEEATPAAPAGGQTHRAVPAGAVE